MAAEHGVHPAHIAMAWLLHKPQVTYPIIGATNLECLEASVAAMDIELTEEEIARLEAPQEPHPVAMWETTLP